jgi:hypothetical protein
MQQLYIIDMEMSYLSYYIGIYVTYDCNVKAHFRWNWNLKNLILKCVKFQISQAKISKILQLYIKASQISTPCHYNTLYSG